MKKYLLGLFAIGLAVGFSAFTISTPKQSFRFVVYQAGVQTNVLNYLQQPTQPANCPNNNTLCWIRLVDTDGDGTISQVEFTTQFNVLDINGNGSLNDEPQIPNVLDKKA